MSQIQRHNTTIDDIFYKITNYDEHHFDHKYCDGLNILKGKFAENGSCVAGGFYFTNKENIHHFYCYGEWIREIYLPIDDPKFKIVKDENKWRANMIILGTRRSLYNVSTYIELKLKIMNNLIDRLIQRRNITALEQFKNSGLKLKYTSDALDFASRCGLVDVLQWWKNSGLELKYTSNTMDYASANQLIWHLVKEL